MTTARLTFVVVLAAAAACHSSRRSTVFGHLSGGVDAERTETTVLDIATGELLEVSVTYGNVEVRTRRDASPGVVATIRAGGRSDEEAARVAAAYSVAVERAGRTVRVSVAGEPTRVHDADARLSLGAMVDLAITVPEGVELRVDTRSGDIVGAGPFGPCRVETRYGGVSLEHVAGDVAARSDSGDVVVRHATDGDVTAESGYGSVRLEDIAAPAVRAASKSGDVVVVGARAGIMELDTHYGAVSVSGADGDLRAATRSGDIDVIGMHGAVNARSQYGQVVVEGVLTGLAAKSSSGRVTARALEGSTNLVDWELSSGYGDVVLQVPPGFGCQLVASTRHGEIGCELPIDLPAGRRRSGALKGTVGNGGRTVSMQSSSGNLSLRSIAATEM